MITSRSNMMTEGKRFKMTLMRVLVPHTQVTISILQDRNRVPEIKFKKKTGIGGDQYHRGFGCEFPELKSLDRRSLLVLLVLMMMKKDKGSQRDEYHRTGLPSLAGFTGSDVSSVCSPSPPTGPRPR